MIKWLYILLLLSICNCSLAQKGKLKKLFTLKELTSFQEISFEEIDSIIQSKNYELDREETYEEASITYIHKTYQTKRKPRKNKKNPAKKLLLPKLGLIAQVTLIVIRLMKKYL